MSVSVRSEVAGKWIWQVEVDGWPWDRGEESDAWRAWARTYLSVVAFLEESKHEQGDDGMIDQPLPQIIEDVQLGGRRLDTEGGIAAALDLSTWTETIGRGDLVAPRCPACGRYYEGSLTVKAGLATCPACGSAYTFKMQKSPLGPAWVTEQTSPPTRDIVSGNP